MVYLRHEGNKDIRALRELYSEFREFCEEHNPEVAYIISMDQAVQRVLYSPDHDRVGLGTKRHTIDIALRRLAYHERIAVGDDHATL